MTDAQLLGSKEDLARAVLAEAELLVHTQFVQIEDRHPVGGEARLTEMLTHLSDCDDVVLDAALALLDDPLAPPQVTSGFEDTLTRLLEGEVRSAVVSGELHPRRDAHSAAEYLVSAILRLRSNRLHWGSKGFPTAQLVDLTLQALRQVGWTRAC